MHHTSLAPDARPPRLPRGPRAAASFNQCTRANGHHPSFFYMTAANDRSSPIQVAVAHR